jgi:two-component system, OmpR family, sensor histidine kinase VicK
MQLADDFFLHHILKDAPIGICILDAATLTNEIVSPRFVEITNKPYETLFNKHYWDSFPEARAYQEQALSNVIKNGEAYHANEIELMLERGGKSETVFLTFVYSPIKDKNGAIVKVSVWLSENTAQTTVKKEIIALNKTLEAKNEQLAISQLNIRNMIQQAPVGICIVSGRPLFVDDVNDLFLQIIGKKREAFLNTPYWEVNAEARSIYEPITNNVLDKGATYHANEHEIILIRYGRQETVFVDFVYEPMLDINGKITAIMIVATEVTDKVLARRLLQNINDEMAASNKEILASNEEMAVSNEELFVTNEELAATQQQLIETLGQVAESEERFRTIAESSGILIAVGDHTSNDTYFNTAWVELTGKSTEHLAEFGWDDLVHPDDRERYVNIYLDAFKYKIPFTGEFRVLDKHSDYRWLLGTNTPRFRRDGSFSGYISSCIDITERKQQEEERIQLSNSIKASEIKLKQVINQMPAHVVLLSGPEMIIESVNQQVFAFWKKTKSVIGKPLLEVLPELKGQPFPLQLDHVFTTGEAIYEKESPVDFENDDGTIRKAFVDYSYQPIWGADGKPTGVMVMSFDVTDKVTSRGLLEKYAIELQSTNEELATTNEELIATIEELRATNEELAQIQFNLERTNTELGASEVNFRSMLLQSPVAMGLFKGVEMRLELINSRFLELWGRDESIIGKTLLEALPEMRNQPYYAIMQDVFRTGETYYGNESEVYLFRQGRLQKGYYNFINHPFLGDDGTVTGLIVVATEVTEQVKARQKLRQAEEMLGMAIEAAKIGSWHIDPISRELKYNATLARIFGYEGETPMTFEQAIGQVTEEFRYKILKQIDLAIATGEDYDITYAQHRFNDNEIVWLRSLGKISADDKGNYSIFSGVAMDVTEQKADEQRKNDFIGMVSHELKTPLTSLTAIVQVANAKLKNHADPFLSGSMEKANIQVKRMSNMINGFLNLSRLESGKMLLIKSDFSLDELIKEIIKEHKLTVTTHIIELNLCDHVKINADRDKMGSVIANLISNAVKYSPKGKLVEVKCRLLKNEVRVSVKDEGMGMKAADLPHVFDRYFRVETHHTYHISGFGIGLYLSAEIVKQHQGKIWAESESGVGSTFYFSLPL